MSDQLSRRDFLKLAGAGALGLAFRKPIQELDKANIEVEQEKIFETEKAIYIYHSLKFTLDVTQINEF
ncbi:MAG: hypothetical protein UX13_C0031G0010 [Candidatus Woesebacteria bacterium GW2011_GWB1_45_5]|uniref:Twin-arginine translocation signal domain-containing protein n=1 Tax=Candidatus Woesebacteria bacterium GW2011_GWB1_45_5 TaxID=1618581 RepID=A0A0G1MN47_9BACT|nr:MAG: hypothetical protein UX13_C0031G0010 [Candidatus Woesebacteria bacterium GW2011_GWB1_45_5]